MVRSRQKCPNIRCRWAQGSAALVLTLGSLAVLPAYGDSSIQVSSSSSTAAPSPASSQVRRDYTVLHVSPSNGSDSQGSGSESQPFQTITQALSQAPPAGSTVILLSPGRYSRESGEQFPLQLRPGITLQGHSGQARRTWIVGGGREATTGSNTAVLAADRSGIAHLLISNPEGQGIWVRGGSPIIRGVVLTANATVGIQVDNGSPIIERSYFYQNGQTGLALEGQGSAVVQGNYFDRTAVGVTIESPATPAIRNNRIANNAVGIVLRNHPQPLIRDNVLSDNQRNGQVETTASVASAPEPSAGEETANLEPADPAVAETSAPPIASRLEQLRRQRAEREQAERLAAEQAERERAERLAAEQAERERAERLATGPTERERAEQTERLSASTDPDLALSSSNQPGIPVAVVPFQSQSEIPNQASNTTPETAAPLILLPVTDERIQVPGAAIPSSGGAPTGLRPPGMELLAQALPYLVLVEMSAASSLRQLVPDAFRTQVNQRTYMQAGAYADEATAQERLDWLRANGIEGRISRRL